jgi:hypothetical protein
LYIAQDGYTYTYEDKKYDYSTKRYSNILKNVKINLDALAKGGKKTWNK